MSERVAIAAALKEEIKAKVGERRGRPAEDEAEEKPENFPGLNGRETRDVVAEKAGFGNPKTFEQAEKVVLKGHADLVKAMDDGEVSISAAQRGCAATYRRFSRQPRPPSKTTHHVRACCVFSASLDT